MHGVHGEGGAEVGLGRGLGQQGALAQPDAAVAGTEVQVHGRARIQREAAAIGEQKFAPLAGAGAQVGAPLRHGLVAVGQPGGAHGHAAQAQGPAQHLAAFAGAGLGTGQGVAQQAPGGGLRHAQPLQRDLQLFPGGAVLRVRVQPLRQAVALGCAHVAGMQLHQPADRGFGGAVQRGTGVASHGGTPGGRLPAAVAGRWQCGEMLRSCGGAPCCAKCPAARQWHGRSVRRAG